MKFLLLLLLLAVGCLNLRAQNSGGGQVYNAARAGYRLTYPLGWWVQQTDNPADATFYAGESFGQAQAVVTLTLRPVAEARKDLNVLAQGLPDSISRGFEALPQGVVQRFEGNDAGPFQQIQYEYTYLPAKDAPTRVVGRRLWRNGYEYRVEYRAPTTQDAAHLAAGRALVQSVVLTGKGPASRLYADQHCDGKMYGIAALRFDDDTWQDDCRTIHEFSVDDPEAPPVVHRRVLPFQSYALAKGFDNCLYSVTKAPTDAPELVYRYDPATRQGAYTHWQLPAQGPEIVWISAATDARGDLYFITSDGNKLVRVSPSTDAVAVVWSTDPVRRAPYYRAIGFAGAGTHANFCIDETGLLTQVYSTDGSLLQVDLKTLHPLPDLLPTDGLPNKGGYSDVLYELDAAGRRRLYLAGPKSVYEVDQARHRARRIRGGVYTDLAGCDVFQLPAPPVQLAPAWRGRVLDAVTRQPLPQARLLIRTNGTDVPVPLTERGNFVIPATPGQAFSAQVQLPGYLALDSTYRPPTDSVTQDVLLRPLTVGTTLKLNNVQFEQGRSVMLPTSVPALNQLLTLLTQNPRLTIELRGHTDNVGDPQKNVVLSQQRVSTVRNYLVNHGISAGRITGKGLGGAEPLASNEQESTRQLNRRVEARVTGVQ